jgi:hypothetical protein
LNIVSVVRRKKFKEKYSGFSDIMKKIKEEYNNILSGFPDNLVKLINESLDTDDYSKKLSAKETLVKMGKTIIPHGIT